MEYFATQNILNSEKHYCRQVVILQDWIYNSIHNPILWFWKERPNNTSFSSCSNNSSLSCASLNTIVYDWCTEHWMPFCSLVGTAILHPVASSHKVIFLLPPNFPPVLLTSHHSSVYLVSPCITISLLHGVYLCIVPLLWEFHTLFLSSFGRWEIFHSYLN